MTHEQGVRNNPYTMPEASTASREVDHRFVTGLHTRRRVRRSGAQSAGQVANLFELQGVGGMAPRQKPPQEQGRGNKVGGSAVQAEAEPEGVRARLRINAASSTNPVRGEANVDLKHVLERGTHILLPRRGYRETNGEQR